MTERTTAWKDLYSTTLINTNFINTVYELQPIPEIVPVKWRASLCHNGNCNQLNGTNRANEETSWCFHSIQNYKAIFLFDQYPPDDILKDLARLCWF